MPKNLHGKLHFWAFGMVQALRWPSLLLLATESSGHRRRLLMLWVELYVSCQHAECWRRVLCRIARRRYAAWRYRCASESANADTKNANKRKTSSATRARGIIATRTGDVRGRGRGQGHAPAQGHAVTEEGGQCRCLIITHAVSFCINGLERLVSEMTYVCVDGDVKPCSLTHAYFSTVTVGYTGSHTG